MGEKKLEQTGSLFEIITEGNVSIVKLPMLVNKGLKQEFEENIQLWSTLSSTIVVVDFKNNVDFDLNMTQSLVILAHKMQSAEKRLVCINYSKNFENHVNEQGLTEVLNLVTSLNEYLNTLLSEDSEGEGVSSYFIDPFVEGVVHLFEVQFGSKIAALPPYIKDQERSLKIELAGVVNISNEWFDASISICFENPVYKRICKEFLGLELEEVTSEAASFATEILNIVYGHAKSVLNVHGVKLDMAIPTVMLGSNLVLGFGIDGRTIVLPFESEFGMFYMQVIMRNK